MRPDCVCCVGVLSQHLIVCKGRSVQLYTFKVTQALTSIYRAQSRIKARLTRCVCLCALCCVGCEGAGVGVGE
jgi:hypothetical protein